MYGILHQAYREREMGLQSHLFCHPLLWNKGLKDWWGVTSKVKVVPTIFLACGTTHSNPLVRGSSKREFLQHTS